jgi:hypothetical protein
LVPRPLTGTRVHRDAVRQIEHRDDPHAPFYFPTGVGDQGG